MNSYFFRQAAEQLDVSQVAGHLGLTVSRGFIRCPFHSERTASCKLYAHTFHCFGCGAHGDSVSLAAQVWNCGQFEALQRLNVDFSLGLNLKTNQRILRRKRISQEPSAEQIWYERSLGMLAQFCRKLGGFQCFDEELRVCEELHQKLLVCEPQNAQMLLGKEVVKYERYFANLEKLTRLIDAGSYTADDILAIMGRARGV